MKTLLQTSESDKTFLQQIKNKYCEDKILIEKRKRTQAYFALDHFLSFTSYFDFFSHDAFKIAVHAKYLAQSAKAKEVSSAFLLIPFLDLCPEIANIFEEYKLTKILKNKLMQPENPAIFFTTKERVLLWLQVPNFVKKLRLNKSIRYSAEVNAIFESAAENALSRFKTPIITPEILLITLMEQKTSMVGRFFTKSLLTDTNWYLLRYKIIKRIYNQELSIRGQVIKAEQYFAYLLKTQLPDAEFARLVENNLLPLGVLFFRNHLISSVIKADLPKCIENEVYKSIKATNVRNYSS